MKMYLLSGDKDVLTGMRLAGVDGKLISTEEEFDQAVEEVLKDEDIGILLLTNALGDEFSDKVLELKKSSRLVITQIPDSKHPGVPGNSITRYVQDAIGIVV